MTASFLFTNIRSVVPKSLPLSSLIDSCSASVVALTETWLNDSIPDHSILLTDSESKLYRCDRENRRGGGVLALSKDLIAIPIFIHTYTESTWVSLKNSATNIIIGTVYRPPDMNMFTVEFRRVLVEISSKFSNATLVIFGDFNFPTINWSTLCEASLESEPRAFLDICLDFSLFQLISQPTRRSSTSANILDLILTNHPNLCSDIVQS